MPFPASGGGAYMRFTPKIIRFQRHGCTNRPFFHIVVMEVSILFRNGERNCDESGLCLVQKERIGAHICCVECFVIAAGVLWNIVCIACLQVCNLRLCFIKHVSSRMKSFHVCVCVGGERMFRPFYLWVCFKHALSTVDTHIIILQTSASNVRSLNLIASLSMQNISLG